MILSSIREWLSKRTRPVSLGGHLSLGQRGERAAAKYLRKQGYKIVATRERIRFGEIDIIAVEGTKKVGRTLVFIEVKTRRRADQGRPAEAVDLTRRSRMTRAALAFQKGHGLLETPSRFDVIEVIWPKESAQPEITHLKNAFEAEGHGQMYR
ncbi:MAG: YraN family protein [Lacipirellulaceae bacterium]